MAKAVSGHTRNRSISCNGIDKILDGRKTPPPPLSEVVSEHSLTNKLSLKSLLSPRSPSKKSLSSSGKTTPRSRVERDGHNKKSSRLLPLPTKKKKKPQFRTPEDITFIVAACEAEVDSDEDVFKRDAKRWEPPPEALVSSDAHQELLDTEEAYIADLKLIIRIWLNPLRGNGIITDGELLSIFSNIEDIQKLSSQLLEGITKRGAAFAFNEMSKNLVIYQPYCANRPKCLLALEVLRKKNEVFATFLENVSMQSEVKGLDLEAWLIKPIQRLCKYPLLLREMLRHTETESATYDQLAKALENTKRVLDLVNQKERERYNKEKQREVEAAHGNKIRLVHPSRSFIRTGDVTVQLDKSTKEESMVIFLFNDILLLSKSKGKKVVKNKRFIQLDRLLVTEASTQDQFKIELVHHAKKSAYKDYLLFPNHGDLQVWLGAIKTVLTPFLEQNLAKMREEMKT